MKCVIYARSPLADSVKLHTQVFDCMAYAKEKNMEVIEVFTDSGGSPISESDRGIQRVKNLITSSIPVDCVLVTDITAISRDLEELLKFQSIMSVCQCELIAVKNEDQTRWWSRGMHAAGRRD